VNSRDNNFTQGKIKRRQTQIEESVARYMSQLDTADRQTAEGEEPSPELKGTKGDIIAARIEVPILVVMIYGIVEFIRLGWSQDYYLYTYAPVLGGVAASVGLFTYFFLCPWNEKRAGKNLLVLLGFLPYFYSLYIMGILGLYTIYEGVIGKFSFW
jgi:hypothetical protein